MYKDKDSTIKSLWSSIQT